MKDLKTIEQRREHILNGMELSLKVEGRYTNLRIFSNFKSKNNDCKKDTIFFRLDRYNEYSACLSHKLCAYLDKRNEVVERLHELFGFDGAKKSDLETILELTKEMEHRECFEW